MSNVLLSWLRLIRVVAAVRDRYVGPPLSGPHAVGDDNLDVIPRCVIPAKAGILDGLFEIRFWLLRLIRMVGAVQDPRFRGDDVLLRPTPAGRAHSLKFSASSVEAAQGLFEIFGGVYRRYEAAHARQHILSLLYQ